MDIAREREELLLRQHLDGLLPRRLRRLFEVELRRHGDDEHIVFSRAAHGDERLEGAFGVLPQSCRHFLARERAALVGMHLVLCARPF